jgi:pimeloyl-ACP methyl ester carboxylesterase
MSAFDIKIGNQAITGLRWSGQGTSRGLIIALHGGGYDAHYWHAADDCDESQLRTGAGLGYVLALDRPGYGHSASSDPRGFSLAQQADLLFSLIDRVASSQYEPVFLIGHSMGGILALMMAADARSSRLRAIDVSGVPLRYPAEMQPILERSAATPRSPDKAVETALTADVRRWMFYGADGTFDPALVEKGERGLSVPLNEVIDAYRAPTVLPPLMGRITLPVQWTIADQERSSEGGLPMLEYVRSLLPNCPHLVTALQIGSGHNISLHHVARAYHLRALAFFEKSCLLWRSGT